MESQVRTFVMKRGKDPDSIRKAVRANIPHSIVQTVRADAATNSFFVEMIAVQTLRAWGTPDLLAQKPEVDLLLRLAGTTQISKAIDQIGVKKGEPFLLVVAGPARELTKLSREQVGGPGLRARKLSLAELERIETAALLNVAKA